MAAVYRRATRNDASRLHDIRRRSILELAPPAMPAAAAQAWASKLSLAGMDRKLRDLEIWVVELNGAVAGWGMRTQAQTPAISTSVAATGAPVPKRPAGAWPIVKEHLTSKQGRQENKCVCGQAVLAVL